MHRTQLVGALVVVLVALALIGARLTRDDAAPTPASAASGGDSVAAAATGVPSAPSEPASSSTSGDDSDSEDSEESSEESEESGTEPERLGQAQELVELDGWLQTDATSLADFDGQVRIVQFWTFGCYNCKNTIPHLQAIYDTYRPQGLEIVGVHAPEFDYERDPAAIEAAAQELGVVWPIAIDNTKTNFRSWQPGRRFWPRTFVVDQEGEIRFDHIGEGAYDELEATVAYLLKHGA